MISKFYAAVLSAVTNKRGAAMVEYALLAGLIAVVALGTLGGIGNGVKNQFSVISSSL